MKYSIPGISFVIIVIISIPLVAQAQFWEQHWIEGNYQFSGSGGDALTVSQTGCEEAFVQVTDPTGSPLPAFSPLIINPLDASGDDIMDISTSPVSLIMRARSSARLVIGSLLRSGDGTADFRTSILYDTIPAGLDAWTEITIEFTGEDLSGFDAANLRDVWIFLDRGSENFAGNELYIDYISLGGAPTPKLESPCDLNGGGEEAPLFAEYFNGDSLTSINTNSAIGVLSTFSLDTLCQTLRISITDEVNNPGPPFNAYLVNPVDVAGNDIVDLTDKVNVTMRVRSAEAVHVDVLFRSGGGTSTERTQRKTVAVPGGLGEWTNFTIAFAGSELDGFNPADLRDMWFYLDRGEENFAGNAFFIDHIIIGGTADESQNSPCATEIGAQSWLENWNTEASTVVGGAESAKLTLTTTECEELKITVVDPQGNPHQAFRPLVLNPLDDKGGEITNIDGNVQIIIRARSAGKVPIGVLFRSGDGSAEFRTATLTQSITANLDAWSTLMYTFSPEDLGSFNPEDLVDLWVYLDRENNNFDGNEIYFDYIAIGEQPDTSLYSPCGLPELTVSADEPKFVSFFEVYPNPVKDQLQLKIDPDFSVEGEQQLRLYDLMGRVLLQRFIPRLQSQLELDLSDLSTGVFYLQIINRQYQFVQKIVKE